MQHGHRVYHTGFGDQAFEIACNNQDAFALATFLFADLPGTKSAEQPRRYDILSAGPKPMLSLWDGDNRLYFGVSRYQLAYILMNEVLYHCINTNDKQHALHAGAVSNGQRCIILPGKSGSGKSTLTAWLILNGYQYLTDELVFISNEGQVSPLTRPISLKINETHATWLVPEGHNGQFISCDKGSMIPHRLLNPEFSVQQPNATHIIFPEFKAEAGAVLQKISPAKSCLNLIQSHVNARNLNGHGVAELSNIIRRCQSYKLTYSSFDDLESIFNARSDLLQ